MNDRFNLEFTLATWRRSRESNRAFTADDLDELEQHLRDQVKGLVAAGKSEEEAFRAALLEMGDYGTAEKEYKKVYRGKLKRWPVFRDDVTWRCSMFKNYLTIAVRNMRRRKGYTLLHITGLAVGLACAFVVLLYVQDELTFDRFHRNGERIFRLEHELSFGGDEFIRASNSGVDVFEALQSLAPFVENVVQIQIESGVLSRTGHSAAFEEDGVLYATDRFFELFTFPLLRGDPGHVLDEPGQVVLSRSAARKYFGTSDPIGQVLSLERTSGEGLKAGAQPEPVRLIVSGVADDPPGNSTIQFDMVVSGRTLVQRDKGRLPVLSDGGITYVQTRKSNDRATLGRFVTEWVKRSEYGDSFKKVLVTPVRSIHLADFSGDSIAGNPRYIYMFSAVVTLILLIACINYVNLAVAYASRRMNEMGIRKVLGAQRRQLSRQHMVESLLLTAMAGLEAFAVVTACLPAFNRLFEKGITFGGLAAGPVAGGMLLLVVLVGFLAGGYPSFYLSRSVPVVDLFARDGSRKGGTGLRRTLVVFQFTATVILLASTLVMYKQLRFSREQNLGFKGNQVLSVELKTPSIIQKGDVLKQAMDQIPGVLRVSLATSIPGSFRSGQLASPPATLDDPADDQFIMSSQIDPRFIPVYGMTLAAGRNYQEGETEGAIVNEKAARALGLMTTDPIQAIGQTIGMGSEPRKIIGVVRDFQFASTRYEIGSVVLLPQPTNSFRLFLSMKLSAKDMLNTVQTIEKTWKRTVPGAPLTYHFVDEQFETLYRADRRLGQIFSTVSLIALILAGVGLFGLAAYTAERRTKEIGIRKVLGASVAGLVHLVSREYLLLIGLAYALGIPVAYYLMDRWLQSFAYRTTLSADVFMLTGGMVLLVALVSVCFQALRVAVADPVKSLRYE